MPFSTDTTIRKMPVKMVSTDCSTGMNISTTPSRKAASAKIRLSHQPVLLLFGFQGGFQLDDAVHNQHNAEQPVDDPAEQSRHG